jgi:hypothetical protein
MQPAGEQAVSTVVAGAHVAQSQPDSADQKHVASVEQVMVG